jgi:probable rRNA maturation factor
MDSDGPETVFVTIGAARWRAVLDDAPALCRQAVRATLARAVATPWLASAEVGVLLEDDRAIRRLNARWRDQDRATNVLAFPVLELDQGRPRHPPPAGPVLLGDVIVALETVCAEALQADRPLGAHLCHLVTHGTLHLLGFDHRDDAEAAVMEDLERRILADLHLPDPYADPAALSGGDQHAREAL